jgi:hypothetical protein
MAAMAKRATNPQDIQAIQKNLVDGVQNGSIQPYVGIPLIQELTQRLTEVKAQMAQTMAGAGMPQPPQGQQAPPIAEQVMQQAAQESQGLESLPSNLPQEYAGGGIIAFEHGGEVHMAEGGQPNPDEYFSLNDIEEPPSILERLMSGVEQGGKYIKENALPAANTGLDAAFPSRKIARAAFDQGVVKPINDAISSNPFAYFQVSDKNANNASEAHRAIKNAIKGELGMEREPEQRVYLGGLNKGEFPKPPKYPKHGQPKARGGEVQRFNEGLLVDANYPDSYYRSQAAPTQLDPKSLESYVQQYKTLMPPKGATQTEYEEYLKKRSGDAEANKKQDLNLALMQFGLNLAAGKSPRALENLGEAGIKTLPSVQEAYKQRRLADETSLRGRAELERMARAEEIDALKGGLGIYGDERKIQAEAEKADLQRQNAIAVAKLQREAYKPTDLDNYIRNYVTNEIKNGSTRSPEALALEATNKFPGFVVKRDIAGMQVGAQMAGQGVTSAGQVLGAQTTGIKEWNDLSPRDIAKKAFKEATKQDQANKAKGIDSDLAGQIRRDWIQANTPGAKPAPEKVVVPPPPPPPKGAAPSISSVEGAPAGSKIGAYTTKGWEVKDKNGTLLGYTRSN